MKKWAILAGFAIASSLAHSSEQPTAFLSGNDLFSYCDQNGFYAGVCSGYALGVSDTISALDSKDHCAPQGATRGQIRDVVAKYLRDNPEHRHQMASVLALAALHDTFPCPAK